MNHLIYLCYGDGPHLEELRFSVQSALSFCPRAGNAFEITIFTDAPSRFDDLSVRIETISADQLQEWQGCYGYHYRRKLAAIRHALDLLGSKVALVDTDTYYLRHPGLLFDRISPGGSVMHRREAHLDRCYASNLADYLMGVQLRRRDGSFWKIDANTPMWNSGVIGLEITSRPWVDEALHLTDQLCQAVSLRTIEQFALGAVLSQTTKLQESDEIVFHYYEDALRLPFHKRIQSLTESNRQLTAAELYGFLYPQRPRHAFVRACRTRLGRMLRRAGMTRDKQRKIG